MLSIENMITGEQFLQWTYWQMKPSKNRKIAQLKSKLKHKEEKEKEWGTEHPRAGGTYQRRVNFFLKGQILNILVTRAI